MIKELIEQKDKYFWSKSEEGTIIVGGYNNGRFYGQIELTIDENTATIKMDVSNGGIILNNVIGQTILKPDRRVPNDKAALRQY